VIPDHRRNRRATSSTTWSLAYFHVFALGARLEGGGFSNPSDDKTVRESHFCHVAIWICHAAIWTARESKLLSAELFRTTNEQGLRTGWPTNPGELTDEVSEVPPTKSASATDEVGEVLLTLWLDKMW